MKLSRLILFSGFLVLFTVLTLGQTVVEHSLATAAAGTATAGGAKGVSKSIGSVFGKLSKTLEKVDKSEPAKAKSTQTWVAPRSSSATTAPPSTKPVQPGMIEIGMERSALVSKFGKPLIKAGRLVGPQFVETYYYTGSADMVVVTLREGKVTAVSPPPDSEERPDSKEPRKTASSVVSKN
jgi:hypothetical protein